MSPYLYAFLTVVSVSPALVTAQQPEAPAPKPGPASSVLPPPFLPDLPKRQPAVVDPPSPTNSAKPIFCEEHCTFLWDDPCRDRSRFWVGGEYLLWWIKDTHIPSLEYTGPGPALPPVDLGVSLGTQGLSILSQPGTLSLFGSDQVDNEEHSGGRFSAGYWFDDNHTIGAEASYLFLAPRSVHSTVALGGAVDPLTLPPVTAPPRQLTPGTITSQPSTTILSVSTSGGDSNGYNDPLGHGRGHHHGHDDGDGDYHGNGNAYGHLDDIDHGRGHIDDGGHAAHNHGHDASGGTQPPSGSTSGSSNSPQNQASSSPQIQPSSNPFRPDPIGGTVVATFSGVTQAKLSSFLQGAEVDGVFGGTHGNWYRTDLLAGFRWLELNETLGISQFDSATISTTGLSGQPNDVTSMTLDVSLSREERFRTENNFYGGQLGGRVEFNRDRFFVNLLGKVGLGVMHEEVAISGETVTAGALSLTQRSGVTQNLSLAGTAPSWLVQPTNAGVYSRDRFAVVPEATVRVGYQMTTNLRASLGYTFLYCSEVVRPGDQIDVAQGPGHPTFAFHGTDFWAQGLDLQLEFRY
jgi:Putative beta barrel porin-7 (BBP7)